MTRLGGLVGRYLYPARVVPPTPRNLGRVARSVWASFRSADEAAALPAAVGIDVSDACNLACAVCSREVDWDRRRVSLLKLERFVHVYDQVRPVYLSLSGYGETLLNRELPDMVAHATRAGSQVTVVTNGTLLDHSRVDRLLDAGLAKLKVSIDAGTPEVYARVREGAELEPVLRNVERVLTRRDARRLPGPAVEVQCTVFRDNVDEVLPLLELCHDRLGVEPYFHLMFTYGDQPGFVARTVPFGDAHAIAVFTEGEARARRYGLVRTAAALRTAITQLTTTLASAPCFVPWYSAIVSTDGDVYPRCYHTIRGRKMGNVFETPFADIWNGPAMRAFRRQLREARCADGVCATCRYEDRPMDRVFSGLAALPGLAAASARYAG